MKVYRSPASNFAAEGVMHIFRIMRNGVSASRARYGRRRAQAGKRIGALARSVEDVHKAVGECLAKPGPMLVDARISRSVATLPYRRIHYRRDESSGRHTRRPCQVNSVT